MADITRILDHDPINNVTSWWHDHGDGTYTVEDRQEIEPLLELNQAMRNTTKRRDRWGPGKHVAEIPLVVYYQLQRDGILDDQAALAKWLDRPENLPFRTAVGSLSR